MLNCLEFQEIKSGGEEFDGKVIESENGGIIQLLDEDKFDSIFTNTTSRESPSVGMTACGPIENVKARETNYCFETSERDLIKKTHFVEEGMNEVVMLLLTGKRVVLSKTNVEGRPAVKFVINRASGKDLRNLSKDLDVENDPAGNLELLQTVIVTTLQTLKNAAENGISLRDVQAGQMVCYDRAALDGGKMLTRRRKGDVNLPRFGVSWVDYSTTKYCGYIRELLNGSIRSLNNLSDENLQVPDQHKVENFNKSISRLEEVLTKSRPNNDDIESVRLALCDLEGSYWGSLILGKLEDQIGSNQMKQLRKIAEMAAKPSLLNKIWQGLTGQIDTSLWEVVIPKSREVIEVFKEVRDDFHHKLQKPPHELIVNKVITNNVEVALAQFPDFDEELNQLLDEASHDHDYHVAISIDVNEEFDLRELRNVRTFKKDGIRKAIDRIRRIGQRRDYYLLFYMLEELRMIGPQFVNQMVKGIMEKEHYKEDGKYIKRARQIQGYLEEVISSFPNLENTNVTNMNGSDIDENTVSDVLSKMDSVIARIENDRISLITQ